MMHLSQMIQFAAEAMKGGLSIVNEQNMYNLGAALVKAMGFQNVNDFLTDPSMVPPQQQPTPKQQADQMEAQVKQKELGNQGRRSSDQGSEDSAGIPETSGRLSVESGRVKP
jgi:hypothetical protein